MELLDCKICLMEDGLNNKTASMWIYTDGKPCTMIELTEEKTKELVEKYNMKVEELPF